MHGSDGPNAADYDEPPAMGLTLPRSYSPAESEAAVRGTWDSAGAFHTEPGDPGEPYCIVIPPPNVTAALHLGHGLNNTLQDVLIRAARMRGCNTLWMPGTDHAGIATQTVVEKRLLQQGVRRSDLGREQFVRRVQEWKDEYEALILEQLRAIGCSCDWRRVRFTMDPVCTRAVREAFFLLFRDGLIYRGKRLVNWDPVTRTALADDEVEPVEVAGHMWYLRYPLVPGPGGAAGEWVTVATTRPETMLGDTAVAINPADPRAERLVGRRVRLPIVGRIVPVIADDHVVRPDQAGNPMAPWATGFLKVTPAHDPDDWEIGRRHALPVINVLAPDATISRDHGWPAGEFESGTAREAEQFLGLPREEARARIVEWFRGRGLLEGVRDYRHTVGHSYRSHAPIEPYLSDQWYVRVTDDRLAGEARRALAPGQHEGSPPPRAHGPSRRPGDGALSFFPARYARTFQEWHEGLRDWCISRQLWWGHRIPVWVYEPIGSSSPADARAAAARDRVRRDFTDRAAVQESPASTGPDAAAPAIRVCVRAEDDAEVVGLLEQAGFARDPDVLDTWFSSALWPISTMGWPRPADFPQTLGLLERFNPSTVLVTARDIITLWVSRMVMFNRHLRGGALPFRHVCVHPMVQDGHGQRMSKSLGNGVDPRDIIRSHGADALRFALVKLATSTQDVRLPVDLVCPHCGASFAPRETTTDSGHRVAAPLQQCPSCRREMVSAYGAARGLERPTESRPLAPNSSSRFDQGRNFANKLWNAARFALGRLEPTDAGSPAARPAALADRWIVARLARAVRSVDEALAGYQFNQYADAMYELVWHDFCDWYLEAIKPAPADDAVRRQVLHTVLDAILRLLHPIVPFVTEALWSQVRAAGRTGVEGVVLGPGAGGAVLARAGWPRIDPRVEDEEALATFGRVQSLVTLIRNVRSEHKLRPQQRITLHAPPGAARLVTAGEGAVEALAGLGAMEPAGEAAAGSVAFSFEGEELRLGGLAEGTGAPAERARLQKIVDEQGRKIEGFRRRLANREYVARAPAHVVEETRAGLAQAEADRSAALRALEAIGAGDRRRRGPP